MLSLGKLSASCAHEINNPIQGLLTFGHLMRSILEKKEPSSEDLEEFKGHLDLMCEELERCGNIVSGLLSFARESNMESGEVDLNDVLESVIRLTRHRMELQDITLHLNLDPESLILKGDVNQLQQCFLNLIFNAIEAMPEGGTLSISSGHNEKRTAGWVTVEDSGCGIGEKEMDKIFDPFYTTKPEGQGTGLGLSIAYGIVKGHEGKITVKSEVNCGSNFAVILPLLKTSPDGGDVRNGG